MSRFQSEQPDTGALAWARQAATGGTSAEDMRPDAPRTKRFPWKCNAYELRLLQLAGDLDQRSKQQQLRIALRDYCERKLKAAGIPLPR